jgi:hypothetical protein
MIMPPKLAGRSPGIKIRTVIEGAKEPIDAHLPCDFADAKFAEDGRRTVHGVFDGKLVPAREGFKRSA